MTIEEKVCWESALYWYNTKRPRTQYQTGPRHGQQIADTRKIAPSWGASVLERIHRELRAFGYAWALGSW